MERELAEYRARKAAENKNSASNVTKTLLNQLLDSTKENKLEQRNKSSSNIEPQSSEDIKEEEINSPVIGHRLFWFVIFLKSILWISLWMIFVKLEFGTVFLVLSAFFFMWLSLSGKSAKSKGQLSAYSVFNPNFEVLQGTLTAEQFEREIRHQSH